MRKAFDTQLKSEVHAFTMVAWRHGAIAQISIHDYADSGLIVAGVRMVASIVTQLEQLFSVPTSLRSHALLCSAARLRLEIQKVAESRRADKAEECNRLYQQLVAVAMNIVLKAYEFKSKFDRAALATPASQREAEKLLGKLEYFLLVTLHVACLAKRQIVDGESISDEQKIFGLFELHKELIQQRKFPFQVDLDERDFTNDTPNGCGFDSVKEGHNKHT